MGMEINETDISTGHPLPTFDWARDKIHTEDNHQVHQENARIDPVSWKSSEGGRWT